MSLSFYFIVGIPGMIVRGVANSLLPACLSLVPLTVFLIRRGSVNPERIARHLLGLIFGMSLTYFIFLYIMAGSGMDVVQIFSNRWMSLAVAFLFFVLALSELNVSFSIAGLVGKAAAKVRLDGFFKMMLAGVFVGIVGIPSVSPVMREVIFENSQFLRDILSSDYFRKADVLNAILYVSLIIAYIPFLGVFIFVINWARKNNLKKESIERNGKRTMLAVFLFLSSAYNLWNFSGSYIAEWKLRRGADGGGINWHFDEGRAIKTAADNDAPVMIVFCSMSEPACRLMAMVTFADKDIIALSDKFVPIYVDVSDSSDDTRYMITNYGVKAVPSVAFGVPKKGLPPYSFVRVGNRWANLSTRYSLVSPSKFASEMRYELNENKNP